MTFQHCDRAGEARAAATWLVPLPLVTGRSPAGDIVQSETIRRDGLVS